MAFGMTTAATVNPATRSARNHSFLYVRNTPASELSFAWLKNRDFRDLAEYRVKDFTGYAVVPTGSFASGVKK